MDDIHRVRVTARHAERVIVVAPVRRRGGARCHLGHVRSIWYLLHNPPPSRRFAGPPPALFIAAMKALSEPVRPWKRGPTTNHVRKRRSCPTSRRDQVRSPGHPTRLRPLVALDLLRVDLVPRVQDDDPTRRDLASGCLGPGSGLLGLGRVALDDTKVRANGRHRAMIYDQMVAAPRARPRPCWPTRRGWTPRRTPPMGRTGAAMNSRPSGRAAMGRAAIRTNGTKNGS